MAVSKFSEKQRTVMTWWSAAGYSDYDAIICDGALRSGKTFSMGLSFFLWASCCFDGKRFGLCGKTMDSLRRNLLGELVPYLRSLGFVVEEKRNLLRVGFYGRKNDFYIFGGRDESSASLIQGITFAGVLLDEVVLMPRSFVEQACARCSVAGSRLWFSCNPEGPGHWFYCEWIKKAKEKRALYLHFTMDDNPGLTEDIRLRYRALYSGVFYQRFVEGRWVSASGLVYDFFRAGDCPPVPEGDFDTCCVSCDYGTANPASFGLWGERDGVWFRIAEFYYDSRKAGAQMTDEEYADALEALAGGRRLEAVIVDPSASSFIEALRRRGLPVVKAKNEVIAGIRLTADMLRRGALVICDCCRDAIREFMLYRWDERAAGKDAVCKENDHAMDDIRYFAAYAAGRRGDDFLALSVDREENENGVFW